LTQPFAGHFAQVRSQRRLAEHLDRTHREQERLLVPALVQRPFGRIVVCGLISNYAATEPPAGPRNMRAILTQRLKIQGMVVSDWKDRFAESREALVGWYRDGKLILREDIRTGGLDAFPETLNLLYTGGNNGKLLLKV
jgi:NADPH-dependent curcumin reductase CurA